MTQWHPIFSHLLRSVLHDYYDVETNVPVGDLPREADVIVLRRASAGRPPFRGLWRHLSRWNILEVKGRSESARVGDIELLIEIGLGIGRRLHEKTATAKVPAAQISFWYLANRLGKRFLHDVVELTGKLQSVDAGLWRGCVLGRPLWLVSNRDVPIDPESVPVRMVSEQSAEQTRELAKVVTASDELWDNYGPWLSVLYPRLWKEFDAMAVKRGRKEIDWRVDGELLAKIIRAATSEQLRQVGGDTLLDKIGVDGFVATLTPEQRRALEERIASEKN
jgi:hypothetical protein